MKVSELIEILQRDYKPDESVAYSLWCRADVHTASGGREAMMPEDCDAVLEAFHDTQDCSCGLSMEGLKDTVAQFMVERKASRARAALTAYSPGDPDTHTGLTDLLADAMHLLGRDAVLGAVNTAELHYDEENGGAS